MPPADESQPTAGAAAKERRRLKTLRERKPSTAVERAAREIEKAKAHAEGPHLPPHVRHSLREVGPPLETKKVEGPP